MLVFDITNEESFNELDTWICEAEKYGGDKLAKVLIGNKCDLDSKRVISYEKAQKYAKKKGITYYETSAKDSSNIDLGFIELAELIMSQNIHRDKKRQTVVPNRKLTCCV